ncbi:MAG: ATP-binding protein [Syntrophomonadaceae bacterium]|jgi:predicted AAA+ superfamily ATPase|nr:ATP-binding protein [Syntrophomonadaceae bacterium]
MANELLVSATEFPVVTLLGPRQSGKTTLVKNVFPNKPYYSLEDPDTLAAAEIDPRNFLGQMSEGAILDEVQRLPILLSYLQGLVDQDQTTGRFVLTGSRQQLLHEAINQSLAGRTAMLTLWPLSINELRYSNLIRSPFELIVSGFFPRLYVNNIQTRHFYNSYLLTYIERDVRSMINITNISIFQKFINLLAGRIGQILNLSSLANDVGVSPITIRNWISVLKASYVIIELLPYFENISKRLIKSPKIYFTDVGLVSFLLGIDDAEKAKTHYLRGNLYENLIIIDILKCFFNKGLRPELYFYRDSHGNEVDLLIKHEDSVLPIEIKSAETFTKHFMKGIHNFEKIYHKNISKKFIFYNGDNNYNISNINIVNPFSLNNILEYIIE